MEMEPGCLLDTEMLGEEDQTAEPSDHEVGGILDLDSSEEVSGSSSCITTAMDFEFATTDLGPTSDFNIDNSSMFDISESVIDEKGDCGYLFKDTSIFEDVHVKHTGEIDTLSSVSCINKKTSTCNDLGLRLQIIPLNNLQFVSTIQTSEGLHILAIPAGSNLNILPQISSFMASSQPDGPNPGQTIVGVQGPTSTLSDMPASPAHTASQVSVSTTSKTSSAAVECKKVLSAYEIHRHLQPSCTQPSSCSQLKCEDRKMHTVPSTASLSKQSVNVFVAQDILPAKTGFVKKRPVIVSSNHHNKLHNQIFKPKINLSRKNKTNSGKQAVKQKKIFKESKIVIDLRKLAQTRKKQMVSLLNNPKTKRLLHQHSQKLESVNESNLKSSKEEQVQGTELKTSKSCSSPSLSEDAVGNISRVECKKVLSAYEIHRHLEPSCTQPSISKNHNDGPLDASKSETVKRKTETNTEELVIGVKSSNKVDKEKIKTSPSTQKTYSSGAHMKVKQIFTCCTCFAKFNREGNYKNHLLVHESCEKKQFSQISLLKKPEHEITEGQAKRAGSSHEDSEGPETPLDASKQSQDMVPSFQCEFCSMTFTLEGNLTRHKLTHSQLPKGEARFSCEVCKRCFLQRCDLRRHQLTHSGLYPFSCSVCHKGFIRRSDVTVHEKFHLKEKNYKCDVCSKSYYQSGDLHRHIRTSHSNRCEFACSQCDRKYSTQKSLNQHLNKHLRQRK